MSRKVTLNKEQDYLTLGGPITQAIAGGGGAYAPPVVPAGSSQRNTTVLVQGVIVELTYAKMSLFASGGGERAQFQIVDNLGNIHAQAGATGVGDTLEQSDESPLSNFIGPFVEDRTLSITVALASPNPVTVAAQFALKRVIRNPGRQPTPHN